MFRRRYSRSYYESLGSLARSSAEVVVPYVLDILQPQSVLDVGCGTGTWLAVFGEHGVADVCGIDGDHVRPDRLEIPRERFVAHDLTRPIDLGRTFDLAVSLEVAEHLPAASAEQFVALLTGSAPAVLFSAAIPLQGGVQHRNEQWQGYWAALFAANGFVAVDCIRPYVWSRPEVATWYAQNTLLFVRRDRVDGRATAAMAAASGMPLDVVHPRMFLEHHVRLGMALRNLRRALRARVRGSWPPR